MSIGKFLEATVIYDSPDGRTVYRPWGARGPCYLVPAHKRRRFRIYSWVSFIVMFAMIVILPFTFGPSSLYIGIGAWLVGSYSAMAFLTLGLETTSPPPKPTPEQVNASLRNVGMGPRALVVFLCLGVVMTLASVAVLLAGSILVGILGTAFFGLGTFVFWKRLRAMKTK